MAENSLFAILLRSRWWISFVVAGVIALLAFAFLPADFKVVGALGGFPFVVTGVIAAWKQLRAPSPAQLARVREALAAMPWLEFASQVEAAYRREGYEVKRLPGPKADFELVKQGFTTLASARRWKVGRLGAEPLRDLAAARSAAKAEHALILTIGEVTESADAVAKQEDIRIVRGNELVMLMRDLGGGSKKANR